MVTDGLARTGYDEVALTSLSSADYSGIEETVTVDHRRSRVLGPGVGQPPEPAGGRLHRRDRRPQIQQVRRTGLTFAPEGGTWRMRQVINKLIREEDLYAAVDAAFCQGWQRVKLYFLIGLPTETDEDMLGHRGAGPAAAWRSGAATTEGVTVDRLGRGLRAQGADPVPVVRPEHHRGAAPQGRPAAGTPPEACGG